MFGATDDKPKHRRKSLFSACNAAHVVCLFGNFCTLFAYFPLYLLLSLHFLVLFFRSLFLSLFSPTFFLPYSTLLCSFYHSFFYSIFLSFSFHLPRTIHSYASLFLSLLPFPVLSFLTLSFLFFHLYSYFSKSRIISI